MPLLRALLMTALRIPPYWPIAGGERGDSMANSVWRWLVVLGLALAASVSAHARPDDREKLRAKLAELAAPHQAAGIIAIKGDVARGGGVEWTVWYDRARIGSYLDEAGIDVANVENAQLVSWYRDLTAKLLAAARAGVTAIHGKDAIDPETDVGTEFTSTASLTDQGRVGYHECTFRGSRITYIRNPPDGMGQSDPPAVKPGAVGVEVEIQPDKLIYAPGETISGRFVIRNHGKRRVTIPFIRLPRVMVETAQGKPAPTFPSRVFICGTPAANSPPVVVEPSQSYTHSFSIDTDPLNDTGGVLMEVGRYKLKYPDLSQQFNVPTKVTPVTIEVRAGTDSPRLGARIIDIAVGPDRISVLREQGLLESFDLTGIRTASVPIQNFKLGERWSRDAIFSPDGRFWVRLSDRGRNNDDEPRSLLVHRLDVGSAAPREVLLPKCDRADDEHGGIAFMPFGPDSNRLSLLRGNLYMEVDLSTGALLRSMPAERYTQPSPDGRYLIEHRDNGPVVHAADGGGEQRLDSKISDYGSVWPGRRGLYITDPRAGRAELLAYDGSARAELATDADEVLCESEDGRYVAFSAAPAHDYGMNPKSRRLEMWDVGASTPVKLYEIKDGQPRWAMFAAGRMVCAVTRSRSTYGSASPWYSPTLEIRDPRTGKLERELMIPDPSP